MTKRLVPLRLRKRLGPVQLAALCGVATSTAHRVLVGCRLNRLSYCDRATGEPFRHLRARTARGPGARGRQEVRADSRQLANAVAWFADRNVTVRRVLSDNGACYKPRIWHNTCLDLDSSVKKTRPYSPQTNCKIERFHHTLADGWGYARCYSSEHERRDRLPVFIHEYNHHRPHNACGNHPPVSRLTNVTG